MPCAVNGFDDTGRFTSINECLNIRNGIDASKSTHHLPDNVTTKSALAQSEIRRGWLLILASAAGIICSSVVLPYYTIGALTKPLAEEFGWTRAEVQFAVLFSSGLGALTAPIVGMLSDRYGPRALVLPGLVGLSTGFFIAAAMNGTTANLYFAYAFMAIAGAGTTPITWTRAIASSFDLQRGLALGITLTGTGVCAMLAPSYTVWLLENFGWRGAYVGLGLLPLLLAGPLVYLYFHPKHEPRGSRAVRTEATHSTESGITLGEAVRGYRFWVLCVSILAVYFAVSGVSPNIIPAMTDQGLSAASAARVQGVFGFAIIFGRLVVGALVDRFWAPGVSLVSLSLPVVGCLVLASSPDLVWIYIAVLMIGFAAGAELDLMAFLVAKYFGLRHYAKIYSILYALLATGSGVAPMLFAGVYDRTASYRVGFIAAAILFAIGALVLLLLGRYPEIPNRRSNPP